MGKIKEYFFGDFVRESEELTTEDNTEKSSLSDLEKIRDACAFAVSNNFKTHLINLAFGKEENILPEAKEFISLLLENPAISSLLKERKKEKLRVIRTFFNKEDPDDYVFSLKDVVDKNFTSYEVKICVVDEDGKVLREASKEVAEAYIKNHPLGKSEPDSSTDDSDSK